MLAFLLAFKKNLFFVKIGIFSTLFLPFITLVGLYIFDRLGINPFKTLMDTTGQWAFNALLLSLLVTPLRRWLTLFFRSLGVLFGRRLSDWNWMIRCRRMIGLFSFFYATIHAFLYLYLEFDFDYQEIFYDIKTRPFIILGASALLGLAVLSLSSPKYVIRKLGKNWRKLHRLVYLVAILAVGHFYFLSKHGDMQPFIYASLVFILLLDRVLFTSIWANKLKNDDGMESKR